MTKSEDIYVDIQMKIDTNCYRAHDLLPSENQLCQEYGVSRETVRKALQSLMENGYIQKKQGKGSFVLDRKIFNFPVSGLVSFKELQQSQQITSRTKVVSIDRIAVPGFLLEKDILTEQDSVIKLVRQRIINGENVILDIDYINANIVDELPKKEMENSLYHYLENHLHLKIAYAKKRITVDRATVEDKALLSLGCDEYVVAIRSKVFLEDTRFIQYTESRHRLDKFQFIDFARRHVDEN